ncbi:hypothetical protein ACK32A_11555 [Aeromonas enteropelogenes]|uniref:hypothetical protein n=1 Tax=Aeromonas enteropelogenes TaxID=29489 RepID=UPI00398A3336
MGELIEHSSEDAGIIRIGSEEQSISLKTYQDIYHQITGKTEETKNRYKDAIKIEIGDIKQLQVKMSQLLDVHNVIAFNQTIHVFYEKDRKDVFSSFEKFEAFNASSASPVMRVVLKYNISIIPARLKKPQEYTVTILLNSRVALLKEIRDEAPSFMQGPLAAMMTGETAEIRVDYVDYVIARGFIEAFDEWIRCCKTSEEKKIVKTAQKYSHFIPFIGKMLIISFYGWFIYQAIDTSIADSNSLSVFSKFLIISGITFYLAHMLSGRLLKIVEGSIDSYTYLSWIKLNKGDEQLIEQEQKKMKSNLWLLTGSSLLAIALGVIASQISGLIDRLT